MWMPIKCHIFVVNETKNTTREQRSNIAAHYDLSNELFKTFLDQDYMLYSSGLFQADMGRWVNFWSYLKKKLLPSGSTPNDCIFTFTWAGKVFFVLLLFVWLRAKCIEHIRAVPR